MLTEWLRAVSAPDERVGHGEKPPRLSNFSGRAEMDTVSASRVGEMLTGNLVRGPSYRLIEK